MFRSLEDTLGETPGTSAVHGHAFARLLEQHRRLQNIRREIARQKSIPQSGYRIVAIKHTGTSHTHSTSGHYTSKNRDHIGDTLILFAESPIIVSKLKNLTPTFIKCLKNHDIGTIRIKVRYGNEDMENKNLHKHITRSISPRAAKKLSTLKLDNEVADSIQKLLNNVLVK